MAKGWKTSVHRWQGTVILDHKNREVRLHVSRISKFLFFFYLNARLSLAHDWKLLRVTKYFRRSSHGVMAKYVFFSARRKKSKSELKQVSYPHRSYSKKKDDILITFWALHSNFRVFVVFPSQNSWKMQQQTNWWWWKGKKNGYNNTFPSWRSLVDTH